MGTKQWGRHAVEETEVTIGHADLTTYTYPISFSSKNNVIAVATARDRTSQAIAYVYRVTTAKDCATIGFYCDNIFNNVAAMTGYEISIILLGY